jgi:hypothetical protein
VSTPAATPLDTGGVALLVFLRQQHPNASPYVIAYGYLRAAITLALDGQGDLDTLGRDLSTTETFIMLSEGPLPDRPRTEDV